jgi:hypothetical protein
MSSSLDKNCLFGTQSKQHNFFVIFHNASGKETPASYGKEVNRAAIELESQSAFGLHN